MSGLAAPGASGGEALFAAAIGAAAVFPAELGTISVRGEDRKTWLNGLLTSDVLTVRPGVAGYGLAVVKVGRILSDVRIVDAGEELLLGVPVDRVAVLREHFERYLVMEDATHADATSAWAWIHAHGARAAELLGAEAAAHGGAAGAFDWLGHGGAVLAVPRGREGAALASLHGQVGVVVGDDAAWELLRTARAFPRFGVDYGDQSYPQEASLEKLAVSFNKGCYLGQEVVCRLEMRGHVSKKLVPLRVEGAAPAVGAEVTSDDGHVVGAVSSVARGDASGAPLALATVRYAFSEPGVRLAVAGVPATVLAAPVVASPSA